MPRFRGGPSWIRHVGGASPILIHLSPRYYFSERRTPHISDFFHVSLKFRASAKEAGVVVTSPAVTIVSYRLEFINLYVAKCTLVDFCQSAGQRRENFAVRTRAGNNAANRETMWRYRGTRFDEHWTVRRGERESPYNLCAYCFYPASNLRLCRPEK